MREIEFRGKSDDEWVYGMLLKTEEDDYGEHGDEHFDYLIQTEEDKEFERSKFYITDNSTIGQYTGLKDKNGKKIFEGDIVKFKHRDKEYIATIEYSEKYAEFVMSCKELFFDNEPVSDIKESDREVIGNIYDNPELLEV